VLSVFFDEQTNPTPMKMKCMLGILPVLFSHLLLAQSDAAKFEVSAGGSFAKPKIVPHPERLALAQVTIQYMQASTAKTVGKDKNSGSTAGARITAYLETTDGELTAEDFQELTDYFYGYMQKKMKEAGIDTVAWRAVTATDFYKSGAEKVDLDPSDGYSITAHGGNVLYGGGIPFAFGKIKKASRFCEEIGAPAGFFYLTVDFADVLINVDIKVSHEENQFFSKTTTKKNYKWMVTPGLKVTSSTAKSITLFWNEKSQSESMWLKGDIKGGEKYADDVSDDKSRLKSNFARLWAFRKEIDPIVISTTRDKYKAAARIALEKYAEAFVARTQM
jgi:hypothetical protein